MLYDPYPPLKLHRLETGGKERAISYYFIHLASLGSDRKMSILYARNARGRGAESKVNGFFFSFFELPFTPSPPLPSSLESVSIERKVHYLSPFAGQCIADGEI